ncbi:riboflavin synthase alpha chain [Marininema mesophilum]|uniref:Riboflavin synthase n=1 Tax=Marininema mesophilum TaxID=1048340 RepID=A0A1H2UJS3_9BACL|nr:riboflavin synthase [Marininema mesophilum]SDW56178.1 riboflavin synthase alpha chain [Marininema mesophilum]
MFTGLVEEVGRIQKLDRKGMAMRLSVEAKKVLEGVAIGDSIAVNGVCLTVTDFDKDAFAVDVMPETMKKSNLGRLRPGSAVNLERALAVGDRLGGHFVQGHADGVGKIRSRQPVENAVLFHISVPKELTRTMVDKGSVAVNGISLTLVTVEKEGFAVSIIPHTLEHTQLVHAQPGDEVNIEIDMLGKVVAKLIGEGRTEMTAESLRNFGF